MKEVSEELNDMITVLGGGSVATTAPTTEVPATETPTTEAPTTEAPTTEAPTTEAPTTEAPATETPDERDQIIADLRKKLNEREEPTTPVTETPKPPEPLQLEDVDFVGEIDLEDLDKDTLNKLLNSVYSKGVNDARNITSEKVLLSIPDIVRNSVQITNDLKEASDAFYAKHKDLAQFRKVVAYTFEEVIAENPGKTYKDKDIMDEVATKARKKLELHKEAIKPNENKPKPPRLPGKGARSGNVREKPNTNEIADEISAMNNSIRR